jgi:hypothetical protein
MVPQICKAKRDTQLSHYIQEFPFRHFFLPASLKLNEQFYCEIYDIQCDLLMNVCIVK